MPACAANSGAVANRFSESLAMPFFIPRFTGLIRLIRSLPFIRALPLLLLALAPACALAQGAPNIDKTTANLMAVLREAHGANKADESLTPVGAVTATVDGKPVTLRPAWFDYIGDMQVHFVFDSPKATAPATMDDLARLKLTPEDALKLAVTNMKRVYGKPWAEPLAGDLLSLTSRAPDYNSSYFLDREFWDEQLKNHPEGLVAAPIKRGGLAWVPAYNTKEVGALRVSVARLHAASGRMRISSALYLYKDGRWTVFQPPQG